MTKPPILIFRQTAASTAAATFSLFDYPYHADDGVATYRAVVKWGGGQLTFRFDVCDDLSEVDSPVFAPGRPLELSPLEGDVYLDVGDGCLEQLDPVLHGLLFVVLGLTYMMGEAVEVHTGVLYVEGFESTLRVSPMMLALLERLLPPPRPAAKMQVPKKKKKKALAKKVVKKK